jgi:TRAP-type C4-dicarboxylate transport system substrate-binding protein
MATAVVASAIALGAGTAQQAAAQELLYSLIAPKHPLNEPVFSKWAENVAAATEGRVTI